MPMLKVLASAADILQPTPQEAGVSVYKDKLKETFQKIREHISKLDQQRADLKPIDKEDFTKALSFSKTALQSEEWKTTAAHFEALTNSMAFFLKQYDSATFSKILHKSIACSEDKMIWLDFAFNVAESLDASAPVPPEPKETELMDYQLFLDLNRKGEDFKAIPEKRYQIPEDTLPTFRQFKRDVGKEEDVPEDEKEKAKHFKAKYQEFKSSIIAKASKRGYISEWKLFSKLNKAYLKKSSMQPGKLWKMYKATWRNLMGWNQENKKKPQKALKTKSEAKKLKTDISDGSPEEDSCMHGDVSSDSSEAEEEPTNGGSPQESEEDDGAAAADTKMSEEEEESSEHSDDD